MTDTTVDNELIIAEEQHVVEVHTDDLVLIELQDNTNQSVVEMTEQAIVLEITNTTQEIIEIGKQGPPGPPGVAGLPGGSILTYYAAIDLSGNKVIALNNVSKAVYADNTTKYSNILGISINAALTDDIVNIQTGGELVEPSWNWTPELPIYLGSLGNLTQIPPVSGAAVVVGFAISSNKIFIAIGAPIELI